MLTRRQIRPQIVALFHPVLIKHNRRSVTGVDPGSLCCRSTIIGFLEAYPRYEIMTNGIEGQMDRVCFERS